MGLYVPVSHGSSLSPRRGALVPVTGRADGDADVQMEAGNCARQESNL